MSNAPTPARQQYLDIKAQYPQAIVWFRLGDFYEMFDEDARTAAGVLRITLTSRSFGKDCRVPMCGVPHHAQARFLARLVRSGFSVAICEQVSAPGRGLVEREVTRVVTPGTISEPELLHSAENNYLAAITRHSGSYALAYVDVSTGEFRVTETAEEPALVSEVERLQIAECLVDGSASLPDLPVRHTRHSDDSLWNETACGERLRRHLDARAFHIAGCEGRPAALRAAGAILGYLEQTNRGLLNILHSLRPYQVDDALAIDGATRAMLLGKPTGGDRRGTLHGLLDCTLTPMGARLLGRWLRRPLRTIDTLRVRQEAVSVLVQDGAMRAALRDALRPMNDLERLTARIGQERATPEELLALASSLDEVPSVGAALGPGRCTALAEIYDELDPAVDIAAGIRAAVAEPGAERLIRPGFDPEIDRLATLAQDARAQLLGLEATERERSGIRSLKVGFNGISGYYIEVTSRNLERVPRDYVRKQTMAHAERFITPDLLHWEAALGEAEAALQVLDRTRFQALQHAITAESPRLLGTADALARLDVLCALAETAERHAFSRPELVDSTELRIEQGRHPLVEGALGPGAFIPNDCILGGPEPAMAIVTGPNMGGKSTYLRQVALIVYLAQIGSFVPAVAARIGLADRIFARVGAHDDLTAGHSTFLVEMAETAAIVRLATPRSLVLLDEIGRGTTSYDGLAIAHAVAEHLHEMVGARTLFATHYYDLARAAETWPQARNLHVRADEHERDVVFLYQVERGMADKSFALHVARMAGMPELIMLRAADLLAELTQHSYGTEREDRVPQHVAAEDGPQSRPPLRLAEDAPASEELVADLLGLDLASMTPIDALNSLYALQQRARVSVQQDRGQMPRLREYRA